MVAQAPGQATNRIAHGYLDINLDVVWDTVQTALPTLLQQLSAIHGRRSQGGTQAKDDQQTD